MKLNTMAAVMSFVSKLENDSFLDNKDIGENIPCLIISILTEG